MSEVFALQIGTVGSRRLVPIEPVLGSDLIEARSNFFEILEIEEKYDFLRQSYLEYEGEIHSIALSRLCSRPTWQWSEAVDSIQAINRKLLNLLSAFRMYVDHVPQHLGAIHGKNAGIKSEFKRALSVEYDRCFGYRVMSALRNHVQHSGLPVHTLGISAIRRDEKDSSKLFHSLHPKLSVSRLIGKGSFKASVLAELRAIDDVVELTPLIKECLSSVSRIHYWLRGNNLERRRTCRSFFEAARQIHVEAVGGDAEGLVLSRTRGLDDVEFYSIIMDIDDRIERLQLQNGCPFDFERHVLSNDAVFKEAEWDG